MNTGSGNGSSHPTHKMLQKGLVLRTCIILLTGFTEASLLPDFEKIDKFGWVRVHKLPATWADARLRCNIEGAVLASPTSIVIIEVIKTTMLKHDLSLSKVFVDIRASEPKGSFTSIDGKPLIDLPIEWDVGEPNNLNNDENCMVMTVAGKVADVNCNDVHPYICVVMDPTKQCLTSDKEYVADNRTDSCYKFHANAVPWRRAAMVCTKEHGHLAILNSHVEADVLKKLFIQHPITSLHGADYGGSYAHIGFLDPDDSGEFLTVFGESLAFAGYKQWEPAVAYNPTKRLGPRCGSMKRSGEINDVSCIQDNCPFICEAPFDFD